MKRGQRTSKVQSPSTTANGYAGEDVQREIGQFNDPDLGQLREEFEYTLNERDSSVFSRSLLNHDARYCVWPGQSSDGRKWYPRGGESEVFPWPGASDARVNLIDKYVNKHVALLMVIWNRMRVTVNATESNDEAWANRMTHFLRWMKYTQMREQRAETTLLLNYLLERGAAVKGTFWCKQRSLAYEEMDLESLANLALQAAHGVLPSAEAPSVQDPSSKETASSQAPIDPKAFMDLPMMALREEFDAESVVMLGQLYPDVQSKRLYTVLKDLRAAGFARFPRPVVTMNRPRVVAYSPNEDIFISPDARFGFEDGSAHVVEVMREAKFRAYAEDYGWDPEWAEKIVETQRGNVFFGSLMFNQRLNRQASWLVPSRGQLDTRKLFLVVHSYRRLADNEGVPGIFYTVWNPHLVSDNKNGDLWGKHELLNYDHGKMPFTLYQREHRSRKIDDSRGYGEIAATWQNQIKAEWDNRIDRSSISTLPPSHYPPGQQPDKWGPGVQVPTSNPDAYGFFEPTGDPMGSKEVEESVRQFSDEYFGDAMDPKNAPDTQALRQMMADDFMAAESEADTQTLQLCQQFMPDQFYFRVVGSAKGQPIHASREDIQGEFDLQVGFAVEDLIPEQKQAKLKFLEMALTMDVSGQIDRSEALVVAFETVDPNLGERLLKPAESASMGEVEDEQTVALKLLQGQPVPVKPGQAYQLRLQTLQNFLQNSASAKAMLGKNPQAVEAVKQRAKDLGFQVQQQQNAVIGRGGPAFAPSTQK